MQADLLEQVSLAQGMEHGRGRMERGKLSGEDREGQGGDGAEDW